MTQPDPGQRLTVAVAALCDPVTVRVDRLALTDSDRDAIRATNAQARSDHDERMAVLRARHAAYSTRRDAAGMRRTLAAIIERETAHRAAIEQRRIAEAVVPSLLDRLMEAVHGSGGSNGASGAGAHRSPIGLAAAELLAEIRRCTSWRPDQLDDDGRPITLSFTVRAWAAIHPDDLFTVELVEMWVATGRAIIEPPRMAEARAACPNCGTRHVYVVEDGERVRRAAISINLSAGYAKWLSPSCGTTWDRDHFDLLAAVLRQDQGAVT